MKEKENLICPNCGINFMKDKARIKRSKNHFCSRGCVDEWKKTSMLGEKNHRYGTKHSEEQRQQKSDFMKELWKNEEYRNSVKNSLKCLRESLPYPPGWDENSIKKRKETLKKKFGVEHNWSSRSSREKGEKTCLLLYGKNSWEIATEKIDEDVIERRRKTLLETIYKISYEEYKKLLSNKEIYYKEVIRVTNSQPLHLLEKYEKRGHFRTSKEPYHLDHIIPISYGFANGISPEVIGELKNLRFIPAIENIKKGSKHEEI
jgi:hypothetical protein